MGNGASSSQGSLPSRDTRDVGSTVCGEQHDWQAEQAVAPKPETHSLLQTRKSYNYILLLLDYCSWICIHLAPGTADSTSATSKPTETYASAQKQPKVKTIFLSKPGMTGSRADVRTPPECRPLHNSCRPNVERSSGDVGVDVELC